MKKKNDNYIEPNAEEWLVPTDVAPDVYEADDPGPGVSDDVQRAVIVRVVEQHLVESLSQLRNEVGLTQAKVAEVWGRPQPQVSRLEADPARAELATVIGYLRAIGGHCAFEVEVGDQHYRYELA